MAHYFPRNRRIVKTDDFSSVFRLRPVRRTAHFVLYAKVSEQLPGRLGIVVAKRLAPRAVTRNMIKRMIRETFRQAPPAPADCIVRLAAPVNAKSQPASSRAMKSALRAELQTIMASLPLSGRV